MIRSLLSSGGATKCRTIDKLDIFGDGSCKALYRLDGNANDESGNYHGTETNVTYGGGVYERGVVIQSSKIDLGVGSKNLMPYNGGYSISVWVKRETGKLDNRIVNKSNTVSGYYGDSLEWATDNKIYLGISKAQSTLSNWNTGVINATDDGLFHHIVAIIDRASTAKLYFDGVLQTWAVTQTMANSWDNNVNVNIGGYTNTWTYQGKYDQVRIFNRAITAQEVATLYTECEPTSIVDNINPFEDGSLRALYKFDNDATDATGVYNGTPTNVTYASGKFGNCAVFDGGAYITSQTFSIGTVSSYSFWLKTSSTSTQGIFDYSVGSISFGINGTGNISLYDGSYIVFSYKPPINTLLHIALIVNGTVCSLYINGTLNQTLTMSALNLSGILKIGAYRNNTYGLVGSIDQFRIFNRALTPMEVACLYNETTPLEEPMSVQVDPFKDGSGKALYRLEGNVLDESGNYNGTPTALTYGLGRFGRCAIFNGSSSYITGAGIGVVSKSSNASVSVWFKTSLSSANQAIYSEGGDSTYPGFSIVQYGTNITVWWTSGPGMTFSSWNNVAIVIPDTWNHLVITKQSKTFNMYLNGIYKGSFTIANTSDTLVGYQMTIGHLYGYSYYWNGSIDQLRIFNKALTQAEVTALYNEI